MEDGGEFICSDGEWQRVPASNSSDINELFNPMTFCVKLFTDRPSTWDEAQSECRRHGAHLLVLSTEYLQRDGTKQGETQRADVVNGQLREYINDVRKKLFLKK